MEGRSKQFSRSRDSNYRTAEKTFTKHNGSQHIESEFDHRSDFEEYLKSQCHELVCEVEEYRHTNEMDGCTITFLNQELKARGSELKQVAKQLTAKDLALEQLLKKYNVLKQEVGRLRQELHNSNEQDRKEKQQKSKTKDELAYLNDKLSRTIKEADEIKEQNRQLTEDCLFKQNKIIDLQRQNALLLRELQNVKIELDHLSTKDSDIGRQVDNLNRKLTISERDRVEAIARVRELEKERSQLTTYLDQKESLELSLKDKDSQLQLLTRKLSETEQKLSELTNSNDKLNFELKHSQQERQLERSAYESQIGSLRERLVCQPSERQPPHVTAQSTYFGRDHYGRTYRQQQHEIKVIESLPSEQSVDEPVDQHDRLYTHSNNGSSFKRVAGGIARKPSPVNHLQLERLMNRFQLVKKRGQQRFLFG